METRMLSRKFSTGLLITGMLFLGLVRVDAQSSKAEEQKIRNLIQQHEQSHTMLPHTQNNVFVSGPFEKPIIGGEMSVEDQQMREKLKTERINPSSHTRIERLLVSEAGDMAYEFGYADLSWDTPEGMHVAFESSYVRVWRKENDEWKMDVFMARPDIKDNIPLRDLTK